MQHFPSSWHQMVSDAITNFTNPKHCVLEDSAQIASWDIVTSGKTIHSIPRQNEESERTSKDRRGSIPPIPRRTGHLMREVVSDTTCIGSNTCTENFAHALSTYVNIFVVPGAQNSCNARGTELFQCQGTELLWCQGHRTFVVLGAQLDCIATTAVLDPVRPAKSFIFCCNPLSQPELEHPNFNYCIIIVELWLPHWLMYISGIHII